MTHKVFCLLSGGADSTTTLAIARDEFPHDDIECVTINYGQRHLREQDCARYQVGAYGATHRVIDAQGLLTGMLVNKAVNEVIPDVSYGDLAPGISPTYVSFRNGFMLSLLAAKAQSWVMESEKGDREYEAHVGKWPETAVGPTATIYCGVHADDGVNWAYPDCTPEFIGAMANAIYIGTYHKVRVRAPLQYDTKIEVIRKGHNLGVNFAQTWSCYKGEAKHCGVCPTCRSRREAFDIAGIPDPTEYEKAAA